MNMALHVATLYVCYFPRLFATWPFTSLLQLLDSRRALTLQLGMLDWGRLGEQGNTVSKRQQKCPGCIFTDTYNVKGKSEQLQKIRQANRFVPRTVFLTQKMSQNFHSERRLCQGIGRQQRQNPDEGARRYKLKQSYIIYQVPNWQRFKKNNNTQCYLG